MTSCRPERLQPGQRGPLGRRDVGLAHVGVRVEHVGVGRCDVHVPAHDRGPGVGGDGVAQRGQPGELVLVVLGTRRPPVRHVHRAHPDPAAGRGDRARLGGGEAGGAGDPGRDVVQPHPGEDRHPVPLRLTVQAGRVAAVGELAAEQLGERVVGELGLLQADDVGLPLVQPGQQPRYPLLDRVHVPGRYPHPAYSSPLRPTACGRRRPTWPALPRPPASHAKRGVPRQRPPHRGVPVALVSPDRSAALFWSRDDPAVADLPGTWHPRLIVLS